MLAISRISGAVFGVAGHLEQQQLALQALVRRELKHLVRNLQALSLQNQLLDLAVGAVGGQRDAADAGGRW